MRKRYVYIVIYPCVAVASLAAVLWFVSFCIWLVDVKHVPDKEVIGVILGTILIAFAMVFGWVDGSYAEIRDERAARQAEYDARVSKSHPPAPPYPPQDEH